MNLKINNINSSKISNRDKSGLLIQREVKNKEIDMMDQIGVDSDNKTRHINSSSSFSNRIREVEVIKYLESL
jgi:hypothetical protein